MIPLLLALAGLVVQAAEIELPNGWRFPATEELADEPLRNNSARNYAQAEADFDGNGMIDIAYLFKSARVSGEGLLVRMASPSGHNWLVLAEIDWGEEYSAVGLSMGIEVVEPGSYVTVCGKGYRECAPGELRELLLEEPGLRYFKFESASSIFHWDTESNEFKQTWVSD